MPVLAQCEFVSSVLIVCLGTCCESHSALLHAHISVGRRFGFHRYRGCGFGLAGFLVVIPDAIALRQGEVVLL